MPFETQTESAVIHVIDDNEAHREAATWFLRSSGHEAKAYNSAQAFMRNFDPKSYGLILLDVEMPDVDGIELLEIIGYEECMMPVIMLSGKGTLQRGVDAMKLGALEFLEKPFDSKALLSLIDTGLSVARERISHTNTAEAETERLSVLTKREREIHDHLLQGETNKAMAMALDIHPRTVEFHRKNMQRKLGIENLEDLIKLSKTP